MSDILQPIATAPKNEEWVLLYFKNAAGIDYRIEARTESGYAAVLAFWSTGEYPGWYDSEAASCPLTAFGNTPFAWATI